MTERDQNTTQTGNQPGTHAGQQKPNDPSNPPRPSGMGGNQSAGTGDRPTSRSMAEEDKSKTEDRNSPTGDKGRQDTDRDTGPLGLAPKRPDQDEKNRAQTKPGDHKPAAPLI